MDNSLVNKVKFFGLYFEQKVLKVDDSSTTYTVNMISRDCSLSSFLELRSLDSMTDQELIRFGELIEGKESVQVYINDYGLNDKGGYRDYFFDHLIHYSETIDLMRFDGFACKWMDLEVEKMIEYGWIKFREDG